MKAIAALALASSLALGALPVLAADMPSDEIIMGDGVVTDESGFDWDRFYATVYAVYVFGDSATASVGEGLSIGGNITDGAFLYGGTLSAGTFQSGEMAGEYIAQGIVRAGVLASDNFVLYGLAGIGWETYNDYYYVPVGLGAEIAVSDNITFKLQYQANWIAAQDDVWRHNISAALAFYF